ncbi:hypothetical protein XENORESO_012194 [Xenotaenia resolanae]|uniref:Uncharacterized protein n=1 Tax=Xenotaenia resolanae TaxID=208358 RepID=A0ABV0WHG3_9TELE
MFKEEDPLLSRPSVPPLDGGTECPAGGPLRMDRGYHVSDDRGLGFHLPPYPSTYSPPCPAISYHEEFCSKPDSTVEEPSGSRAALSERHPSFENLELGFTELLPPLYPRGPQPPSPSPSPWLDSPYLSSSPSPSHSSSLSPFPTESPLANSPLPPIPTSPFPQYSAYPQEVCPSPPSNPYQDTCPAPYSHFEGWEPQGRMLGTGHGGEGNAKNHECPLEFTSSASMHITFEEVSEFIGEDIQAYQSGSHMNNQSN